MPLVRYELRCEHSLANPELFRSTARDDPEGLLEGLAMAGLVGIVRQLGDLAEFAAEVFRDLHEEFVSVGGRAHDLTVRVQQLEAELPAVEKALLSEPNQLRFAYTNGADWHASIRSDQNHCTSGELPRFVRNFYQECRGPPRLFLLDKFDVAGAGACLKRYSDPSFFKLEWASSELMKAQRAQRDKKARREKKKGRRRKTGQPIAAINQIPARVRYSSASLDDLDSLSHLLAPTLKNEIGSSSPNQGARNESGTQTQRRSNLGPQNKAIGGSSPPSGASPARAEGGAALGSLKISAKDIEANAAGKFYQPSETETDAESMAGKISKIIETEDRDAIPPVGLVPRNVENKRPKGADELIISDSEVESVGNGVAGEGHEADVVGRTGNAPRGIPSGNALAPGSEGLNRANGRVSETSVTDAPPKGSAVLDVEEDVNSRELRTPSSGVPDGAGSQEEPTKASSMDPRTSGQSIGKFSRRNFVDAKEAHVIAARFPKQNSERSNSGSRDLANAPVGNLLQSLANLKNLTQRSVAGHAADEQRPKHSIPETPAGDGSAPADKNTGSLLSASEGELHGRHLSDSKRLGNNTVDTSDVSSTLEKTVNNPPALPPIRIEEILTNEEEPLMISSQCSSPGPDDLRPSVSMISRLSYSSELMPVSSGSEPDSPVSPNSPPFNALYSPPGSPSRILGGMVESPTGIYMGSLDRPGCSSSQSEIPVLCLSPRSKLASYSQEDHAAPLRPPPPLPIVIRIPEMPSQYDNTQEFSSMESDLPSPSLDLLTSPVADGVPSQSNGDTAHLIRGRENAEIVHAEPAGGRPESPDQLAPLEAHSERTEHIQSSVADLEGGDLSPSNASAPTVAAPVKSSLPSSLDYSEPASTQTSSKSFVNLELTDSGSTNGPTSTIDGSLPTPVGEFETYPVSEPLQVPAPSGVSVQRTRGSSERALNTTPFSISVGDEDSEPSSPTGSVIIKDTPSAPGSPESNYYSESEPEIDEYHPSHCQPVSPRSITHALKDVISHRENGSGDIGLHEDLMFEASESGPTAAVQETGFANSVSDNIVGSASIVPEDHVDALVARTSTHLKNPLEDIMLQGPSSALHSQEASTLRSDVGTQNISVTTSDIKSQKSSTSNSPANTPPRKNSIAAEDEEAPSLEWTGRSRPESPIKIETRVPSGRSASNSPPTSPPKFLDQASSLRWRGRSDPASFQPNFSLPPNLVCRSETSSPPCSPPPPSDLESPKQWDDVSEVSTSSDSTDRTEEEAANVEVYRFQGSRLPPDSPTMSEQGDRLSKRASDEEEDLLSKRESDEEEDLLSKRASDEEEDLLSKRASDEEEDRLSKRESDEEEDRFSKRASDEEEDLLSKRASDEEEDCLSNRASDAEVYRLAKLASGEEGDRLAKLASDEEGDLLAKLASDEECDFAVHQEQKMAEPATIRSGSQLPSEKLSSEALSSALDGSHDGHAPGETVSKPYTIESSTECIPSVSSDTQFDSRQPSALESQTNTNEVYEAPPLPPLPGSTGTPPDALAAAKAHHDWNMMKAMSIQGPDRRQYSPPGGRSVLPEEMERKDPTCQPSANINVATILEKAKAIRQAFVGSDDEGDDEDDWSDS